MSIIESGFFVLIFNIYGVKNTFLVSVYEDGRMHFENSKAGCFIFGNAINFT